MKLNSVYYPPYDVFVNGETGEIKLPICTCDEDDNPCMFLKNWIYDGRPTHVSKEELKRINNNK